MAAFKLEEEEELFYYNEQLSAYYSPPFFDDEEVQGYCIDRPSRQGKFGWAQFHNKNVPFIVRDDGHYFPVVLLKSLSSKFSRLKMNIFDYVKIPCYKMTKVEARLLNVINFNHSERMFGKYLYVVNDLLIREEDVGKLLTFLQFFNKKIPGNANLKPEVGGFMKFDGRVNVPYVSKNANVRKHR